MENIIGGIKNAMIDKLDMPREIVKNSYRIVVEGNEVVTIENHRGILKFNDSQVVVKIDEGNLVMDGVGFTIIYISGNTLKIKGMFKGVNYEQL